MILGVIAFFRANDMLLKKFSGISSIENFVHTKHEYETTPPFMLLAEEKETAQVLKTAFPEFALQCDKNDLQRTVDRCAELLGMRAGEPAKRTAKLGYFTVPEVYVVYSQDDDKITEDSVHQLQWFLDFNAAMQNISAMRLAIRLHINYELEEQGVEFLDVNHAYIDSDVKIGKGTVIYPNVVIEGHSEIGENCIIGMGCNLRDTSIGSGCTLQQVFATEARVDDNVSIGPYVNLRPNTHIHDNCKIGDFVEVKNSNIGCGTKLPHLSYIGDADVGERVNVGCGSIFVNYDGKNKMRSSVGNDVFIGCNSNLVAPISVGNDVYIAAGSTLTDDVADGEMAIARARQVNKQGWIPPYMRNKD